MTSITLKTSAATLSKPCGQASAVPQKSTVDCYTASVQTMDDISKLSYASLRKTPFIPYSHPNGWSSVGQASSATLMSAAQLGEALKSVPPGFKLEGLFDLPMAHIDEAKMADLRASSSYLVGSEDFQPKAPWEGLLG